jgi:hypothetical protein
LHSMWRSDRELADVVEHFQKLADEEVRAGVAQIHVRMTETLRRFDTGTSLTSAPVNGINHIFITGTNLEKIFRQRVC